LRQPTDPTKVQRIIEYIVQGLRQGMKLETLVKEIIKIENVCRRTVMKYWVVAKCTKTH
jgi:hypothetical protein